MTTIPADLATLLARVRRPGDFVAAGIRRRRARELAISFVALRGGAFLLARAAKSIEPMKVTGKLAEREVRAALRDA